MEKEEFTMDEISMVLGEQLDKGAKVRITVSGSSMYPLFRDKKDSVILQKSKDYKKGDIPLYIRQDGRYVLHRIISESDEGFIMCGDNQMIKEYPVRKSQLIAKTVGFYRGDRYTSTRAIWYRFYSFLWTNLYSCRPFMAKIIRGIQRLKC